MKSSSVDNQLAESAMSRNASVLKGRTDNYYRWNLSVFPIEKNRRIFDIGCGPGFYLGEILRYEPSLYTATDHSPKFVEEITSQFNQHPNFEAFQFDLFDRSAIDSLKGRQFDYIFFFDVLEHLEDDRKALENIHLIMQMCNVKRLFLRVPALQWIYGVNDSAIGHYRRYSKGPLKSLLESCSFEVENLQYQNCISIIPWYIIGRLLKRTLAVSEAEGSVFNTIAPFVQSVERVIPPPFGLSLYSACRLAQQK